MSQFIDGLNKISRNNPQPMGFGRSKTAAPGPRIMLIAALPAAATKPAALTDGADAAIVRPAKNSDGSKSVKKCAAAVPGIPWGIWFDGANTPAPATDDTAHDFIVFPAQETPLSAIGKGKAGRLLAVDASLSDGLLRAVDDIEVDGLLLLENPAEAGTPLTWQDLMRIQHIARLVAKPLLAVVRAAITQGEIQQLWQAGVDGLVIELAAGRSGDIRRLRDTIDQMSFASPHHRRRNKALLPLVPHKEATAPAADDDEEYDADD